MALNVGQDFKKRWLNTPETVRQTYQEDLARICDLLLPQTQIQTWIQLEEKAQLRSQQRIDQAYAHLKAELIEQARVRKQLALEKALAEKRAAQAAYAAQLQADELNQFEQQTENLVALRQHIDQEIAQQTERYQANPEQPSIDYAQAQRVRIDDQQILSELESVRVRLELEAENLIEQAVTVFRAKLHALAQDEIDYILKNSKFSDEK
ncbi:cell division protein BlhA [Acinetobacter modestus]|uniref:cell division protein BlhA n=1 Tax=Acinetobacter modestus TaxID=1776740 RepID=UPI00320BA9A1